MFNALLKKWVGKGELDYEVYLKTPTLLNLQTPSEQLVHHDELLFQLTHQAQELWLKLVSMEAVEVVAEMDGDLLWPATGRLERMLRAMRCLVAEMNILETMTPDTYQIIRRSLGNGSGQESPGYNALRLAADGLEAALERVLTRRQLRLLDVYKVGAYGSEDLKRVCEQLVDLDELFQNWLYTHYQMVRRIIGVDRSIKALDGLPTQVLAGRMTLPLFRKLWEVRVEMTNAWKRDGGYQPGVNRPADSTGQAPAQAALPPSPPPLSPPPPPAVLPPPVTVSVSTAPPSQAPSDDPWSKPEPPTSRRGFGDPTTATPPPIPAAVPTSEDPWSRPEPPTSRRVSGEPQEEAASSPEAEARPTRPPKAQGQL
ncbi:tryptophan 2,3-dioxygenase family protein [Stigmatella hybrida]|uniref:tryptophan 2,3-dioxygenase family protein n=1 Tax=Stigmatella hybrida TaxID=394097 RepID=UPI001CDA8DDC|nr:tryptophan 2,3-dioxygenase family protein [Stigmatella hybrida]